MQITEVMQRTDELFDSAKGCTVFNRKEYEQADEFLKEALALTEELKEQQKNPGIYAHAIMRAVNRVEVAVNFLNKQINRFLAVDKAAEEKQALLEKRRAENAKLVSHVRVPNAAPVISKSVSEPEKLVRESPKKPINLKEAPKTIKKRGRPKGS